MDNTYILREIAKHSKKLWRLFSSLNKEMNKYFNILGYEYELCFREIEISKDETCYRVDGLLHRSDGPAVIWNNSSEFWYVNGILHRTDGPAKIFESGDESWYVNGILHRTDGPAEIWANYCDWWYTNGKLHRIDGPAIEYVRKRNKKYNEWWVDGKKIVKENDRE